MCANGKLGSGLRASLCLAAGGGSATLPVAAWPKQPGWWRRLAGYRLVHCSHPALNWEHGALRAAGDGGDVVGGGGNILQSVTLRPVNEPACCIGRLLEVDVTASATEVKSACSISNRKRAFKFTLELTSQAVGGGGDGVGGGGEVGFPAQGVGAAPRCQQRAGRLRALPAGQPGIR